MYSCNSTMDDPLLNFTFGEKESLWKRKSNKNFELGLLQMPNEDSTLYRYYFNKNGEQISADIMLNSDGYNYGNLRIIKFRLGGDSIIVFDKKKYRRSSGPRDRTEVDQLFNWFVEYYGKPDDTLNNFVFPKLDYNTNKSIEEKFNDFFETEPIAGSYIWHLENYQIEFTKHPLLSIAYNNNYDSTKYNKPQIIFRYNSYKNELKKIINNIREKMIAKDIVVVEVGSPKWNSIYQSNSWDYDYRLLIPINNIYRIGKEELRDVIAVQFDVIITDVFDNEISRIKDVKLELDKPIEIEKGIFVKANMYYYEIKYNSNSDEALHLEIARKFQANNNLKLISEVKAVVFKDGEVLR